MGLCDRSAFFLMVVVMFVFPGILEAVTYKWVDPGGNMHFTDDLMRVPQSVRDRVEVMHLPEEPGSPASVPHPADLDTEDQADTVDPYEECQKEVLKEKERWDEQLEKDRARLAELNRLIHRATTSRQKNKMQRERVAVKERITQTEQMLQEKLPSLEQECESIRYWQGER